MVAVAAVLLVVPLPAVLVLIAGLQVAVVVVKRGDLFYHRPAHGHALGALVRAGLDGGLLGLVVDEAVA